MTQTTPPVNIKINRSPPLDQILMELIMDTVTAVVCRLSGGTVPCRLDSVILQHRLLRFGGESVGLREIVASLMEWLEYQHVPRAAYSALMRRWLIGINTHTGFSQSGLGWCVYTRWKSVSICVRPIFKVGLWCQSTLHRDVVWYQRWDLCNVLDAETACSGGGLGVSTN